MPKFNLKHITRYTYPSPIRESANQIMLFPFDDDFQEVKKHELLITNQPNVEVFNDYFGNKVGIFSIAKPINELLIQSKIEIIVNPVKTPTDTVPASHQWDELKLLKNQFPFIDFLWQDRFEMEHELLEVTDTIHNPDITPFEVAQKLSAFVFETFEYKKGITDVETEVNEIWKIKAGVCQDFAHILLAMLRIIGIPARYVSGYICPKNHELRGEGATHAWVEAYLPSDGWIGLDPTNNCVASDRHIRLAIGRNFGDCTPVKGTYKGSTEHTLEVSVTIENDMIKSEEEQIVPVFSYQIHRPGPQDNSYRMFMEMQQQQQQQQQQQ